MTTAGERTRYVRVRGWGAQTVGPDALAIAVFDRATGQHVSAVLARDSHEQHIDSVYERLEALLGVPLVDPALAMARQEALLGFRGTYGRYQELSARIHSTTSPHEVRRLARAYRPAGELLLERVSA